MAVVIGATAGVALLYRFAEPATPERGLPQLSLLGKPLELDANAPQRALNRLRRRVNGVFVLKLDPGDEQRISYGDLGVQIDKARLAQLLRDTVDQTSPLSRWRRRSAVAPGAPLALPVPFDIDVERAARMLMRLKDEFDRPAVDARLDLEHRRVVPSSQGRILDVDATLQRIQSALQQGEHEAELAFELVSPRRTTEQLADVRFDHVLSYFETNYDVSMRAEARTFNLRLAASKLDGTVLLPGEVFDFNQTVGARDEANGYKVAPVIAQGELVDGIGGGTCQVSGTLHGAAFFAGLEVVERYPHTRPSSYIKLGLDATVVYPTINFGFRNPYDFPVVLHETVKDGVVRAEILGPQSDGSVTLIRRILSARPYDEVERPDDRLRRGQRVLAQRGVPGFTVQMYRILRDGPHARREVWKGVYPPTTQIVRVGTATDDGKAAGKDDPHGEYLADELLVVTMARDEDSAEPKLTERREEGRFGVEGWTNQAGMPVFRRN